MQLSIKSENKVRIDEVRFLTERNWLKSSILSFGLVDTKRYIAIVYNCSSKIIRHTTSIFIVSSFIRIGLWRFSDGKNVKVIFRIFEGVT